MAEVSWETGSGMTQGERLPEEARSAEMDVYGRPPPTVWNGIIREARLDDRWIHNREENGLYRLVAVYPETVFLLFS